MTFSNSASQKDKIKLGNFSKAEKKFETQVSAMNEH